MLTNLLGPFTNPLDAVSINYIKPAAATGPLLSVQYNDNGIFAGSPNLTFNQFTLNVSGSIQFTGTSTSSPISDGSTIHNLIEPVNSEDIVTKIYADNYTSENITSITSSSSTSYSASEVVNGVILRSSGVNVTDSFPSASSITSELFNLFSVVNNNSFVSFTLINNGTGTILLTSDSSVTLVPSTFSILPDYILNSYLIVTNTSYITMNVNSISFGQPYISSYFSTSNSLITQFPYAATESLLGPIISTTVNTSINYTYTSSDLANNLSVRAPATASSDVMSSSFLPDDGGSLIIQNVGAGTISLTATTPWTFNPSGPLVVAASSTGIFWINISEVPLVYTLNVVSIS